MGAAHSRATRRGRRPRRPAKPPANGHPPGSHPRRGQDPSLRAEPLTGAHANPRAGRLAAHNERRQPAKLARSCGCLPRGGKHCSLPGFAPLNRGPTLTTPQCPAPTARRPGNGCPRKPRSVSISPSVGRGAPTPPRPSAAANNNPCLPPWGKVAPQGRMRGRLPLPPIPGQTVGGGVPDTPRRLALAPFPGLLPAKPSANGHPPGNHPQTSAHANPRAGHARPLPGNNPTHLYTTQKGGSHT